MFASSCKWGIRQTTRDYRSVTVTLIISDSKHTTLAPYSKARSLTIDVLLKCTTCRATRNEVCERNRRIY